MDKRKLLARVINNPRDVRFADLVTLAEAFGFRRRRVRGSHQTFSHPGVPEVLNLQEIRGRAKAYQVWQFLRLVERNRLRLGGED